MFKCKYFSNDIYNCYTKLIKLVYTIYLDFDLKYFLIFLNKILIDFLNNSVIDVDTIMNHY